MLLYVLLSKVVVPKLFRLVVPLISLGHWPWLHIRLQSYILFRVAGFCEDFVALHTFPGNHDSQVRNHWPKKFNIDWFNISEIMSWKCFWSDMNVYFCLERIPNAVNVLIWMFCWNTVATILSNQVWGHVTMNVECNVRRNYCSFFVVLGGKDIFSSPMLNLPDHACWR